MAVPPLHKRLVKGSELTAAEHDENMAWLENQITGLLSRLSTLETVLGSGGATLVNQIFPVGSTFITVGNNNPGSFLPGTTSWSLTAEGRFLVGVGTGSDGTDSRGYYAGDDSIGRYRITQSINQMPEHEHELKIVGSSGGGDGLFTEADADERATSYGDTTNEGGDAMLTVGGGQSMENSPPAFGVYIWERTS